MNRKDFLKSCLAVGITLPLSRTLSDSFITTPSDIKNTLPFYGIKAMDAHSHPYNLNAYPYFLNGKIRHLKTTSTVDRMRNAGLVASVFAAVGDRQLSDNPSKNYFADAMDQLNRINNYEEKKILRIIRKNSDLVFPEGKEYLFGAIMAIEGGDALEGDILNIEKFYDYGVRLITIMHKRDNEIGFNQESKADGPLSAFGTRMVEKMNETGMIVDVAHSATKTLKSIAEISKLPLLDSHTAPFPDGEKNTFPNRARSWAEMELIAKSGGVICSMPIGYTLGNYSRTTLKSWAVEIALMKTRLGIEHIGLGTDSGGLPRLVNGWDSISSLPDLINELLSIGLSKDDIIAFTGGNFLRIAKGALT
ncbi:MAG: membrane dipeptidase [Bacteroidia bacterium]|nr:membrane dipeptidase [Bacteroidia bacterium]